MTSTLDQQRITTDSEPSYPVVAEQRLSPTSVSTAISHVHADLKFVLQIARIGGVVLACDLVALTASIAFSWLILATGFQITMTSQTVLVCWSITTLGQVLGLWLVGLYPAIGVHPATELKHLFRTSLTVNLAVIGCLLAFVPQGGGAPLVVLAFGLQVLMMPLMRSTARSITRRCGISVPFFFYGDRQDVLSTYRDMHRFGWPMMKPVGRFEDPHPDREFESATVHVGDRFELEFERDAVYRGTPDCMAAEARALDVYWLVRVPGRDRPLETSRCETSFPCEVSLTSAAGKASSGSSLVSIGLANGVHTEETLLISGQIVLKRMLDLVISITAIVLLLPVFVCIALLIRLSGRGPIMFGSRRVGRGGKVFRAWKFRTMVENADDVLRDYLDHHPELHEEWLLSHKLKHDPRITTVGRILRKTSLDELPQLFNVVLGQMSLVGPRPMLENERHRYGDTYDCYLRVSPGITGLWQISGRNNTSYEDRLRYVQIYVRDWSPWMDLYILLRTIKTVLFCEGAY